MGRGRNLVGVIHDDVGSGVEAETGGSTMKEQQQPRRGGLKTLAAFAAGAAIGSVTALLTAPASGAVTRRRLGKQVKRIKQNTARGIARTRKQLIHKADGVREQAAESLSSAREWMVTRVQNGYAQKRPARRTARRAHA